MAENIWTVEKTEIDYSKPEATYFGVTEKNGKTYRDEQKVNLTEPMLESFKDSSMQQWQAFKDAVNELTGVTDWTFDSINNRIFYTESNSGFCATPESCPNNEYLFQRGGKLFTTALAAGQYRIDELVAEVPTRSYTFNSTTCPSKPTEVLNCYVVYNAEHAKPQTYPVDITTVLNPSYNPNADGEVKYLPLPNVAQKIISNTLSTNEGVSLLAEAYINEVAKSFVTPVFDDSIIPTEVPDFVCSIDENFINYQEKARGRYTYILDTPEFDALVQTLLEQRMERQCQYLMLKDSMFDIDKSKGSALDQIGRLVGQPRMLINFITDPYFGFEGARNAQAYNIGTWYTLNAASRGAVAILDDEMYKRTIKARIIKNGSNNSRSDLLNVLNILGGGSKSVQIKYTSHGNIQIGLDKNSDPDGLIAYFLSRVMREDSIIPRQLGYKIGQMYEELEYITSKPYVSMMPEESINNDTTLDDFTQRDIIIHYPRNDESFENSIEIDSFIKKSIYVSTKVEQESVDNSLSIDSFKKYVVLKTGILEEESVQNSLSIDSLIKKSAYVSYSMYEKEAISNDVVIDSITTDKVITKEPYGITYRIIEE